MCFCNAVNFRREWNRALVQVKKDACSTYKSAAVPTNYYLVFCFLFFCFFQVSGGKFSTVHSPGITYRVLLGFYDIA